MSNFVYKNEIETEGNTTTYTVTITRNNEPVNNLYIEFYITSQAGPKITKFTNVLGQAVFKYEGTNASHFLVHHSESKFRFDASTTEGTFTADDFGVLFQVKLWNDHPNDTDYYRYVLVKADGGVIANSDITVRYYAESGTVISGSYSGVDYVEYHPTDGFEKDGISGAICTRCRTANLSRCKVEVFYKDYLLAEWREGVDSPDPVYKRIGETGVFAGVKIELNGYTYTLFKQDFTMSAKYTDSNKATTTEVNGLFGSILHDGAIYTLTNLNDCFSQCYKLEYPPKIPITVTTMNNCFKSCTNLKCPPVLPPNVNSLNSCFESCSNLNAKPGFIIPVSVRYMRSMFAGAQSLTNMPLILTSSADMYLAFYNTKIADYRGMPLARFSVAIAGSAAKYGSDAINKMADDNGTYDYVEAYGGYTPTIWPKKTTSTKRRLNITAFFRKAIERIVAFDNYGITDTLRDVIAARYIIGFMSNDSVQYKIPSLYNTNRGHEKLSKKSTGLYYYNFLNDGFMIYRAITKFNSLTPSTTYKHVSDDKKYVCASPATTASITDDHIGMNAPWQYAVIHMNSTDKTTGTYNLGVNAVSSHPSLGNGINLRVKLYRLTDSTQSPMASVTWLSGAASKDLTYKV